MKQINPDSINQRDYEQIFTGVNQTGGYETPFLEFTADTVAQIFEADKLTYFHYPRSAESTPLSSSTIIESGAIAGPIPYKSDKIWKKAANYEQYIYWGNSSIPQPGIWLCAWLSAGYVGQDPVWMDRYYDPGYTDGTNFYYSTSAVRDFPSILTFDPGVWYRYMHIGSDFNDLLADSLSGTTSALKVHLQDWASVTPDLSPYGNDAVIDGDINAMVVNDFIGDSVQPTLQFNEQRQAGNVVYDTSYEIEEDITVAGWIKAEDWITASGHDIIGKNLQGGWSIRYNSGFFNPLLVTFSESGTGIFINSDGDIIGSKTLPNNAHPVDLITTSDLHTWILDDYNNKLYKMDYTGLIEIEIPLAGDYYHTRLDLDQDENIVVNGSWTNTPTKMNVYTYDPFGNFVTSAGAGYNLYFSKTIPKFFEPIINVGSYWGDIGVDNNNGVWRGQQSSNFPVTNGVHRDQQFATGGFARTFTGFFGIDFKAFEFDSTNYMWALVDDNGWMKINTITYEAEMTGTIGSSGTTHQGISLTRELTDKGFEDFVWIAYDDTIWKLDSNAKILKTIDLSRFDAGSFQTRFTNYDWSRRFNYIENDKLPTLEARIHLGDDNYHEEFVVDHSVVNMSHEWHHVAMIRSADQLSIYVDAVNSSTISLPVSSNYYRYENAMVLGTDPSKDGTLLKDLRVDSLQFIGGLHDVRVYNDALSDFDLWNIYMSEQPFEDMTWNMPSGPQSYLEEIERFFKFKLPGSKSQYYNIKLIGLQIDDPDLRLVIEDIIMKTVKRIAPTYTELFKIIWE